MMTAFLLARAGVEVAVLEKHADFNRDFRGDTIHPSTLELMHELGLLEEFLKLPHQELREIRGIFNGHQVPIADFVTGAKTNVLAPGEILRRVDLPAQAFMRRAAFRQISLTPFGRSAALLIGTLSAGDGAFALTITASTARPVRLSFAGLPDRPTLRERIASEIPDALYYDDVHGDPRWRKHVTLVLAEEIRRELSGGPAP